MAFWRDWIEGRWRKRGRKKKTTPERRIRETETLAFSCISRPLASSKGQYSGDDDYDWEEDEIEEGKRGLGK